MNCTVRTELIEKWIRDHGPNAVAKLQVKAGVSKSTIENLRKGIAPKRENTRLKISESFEVGHDDLFRTLSEEQAVG